MLKSSVESHINADDPDAAAAAAELDDVACRLPDAEAAQLAAQHAQLGGRLAALQVRIATHMHVYQNMPECAFFWMRYVLHGD